MSAKNGHSANLTRRLPGAHRPPDGRPGRASGERLGPIWRRRPGAGPPTWLYFSVFVQICDANLSTYELSSSSVNALHCRSAGKSTFPSPSLSNPSWHCLGEQLAGISWEGNWAPTYCRHEGRPEVPSGCLLVRQHAVDRGPTYPEALGDPRWRPGWPACSGWRRWRRSATGRRSGRSAGPSRCRAHSIRKRRRRKSGRRLKKLAAAVAEEAERHPETRMHGGVGGAEPRGALLSRSQRGCAGHSALKPASSG